MFISLVTSLAIAVAVSGGAIGWFANDFCRRFKFHRIKVGTSYGWVIAW